MCACSRSCGSCGSGSQASRGAWDTARGLTETSRRRETVSVMTRGAPWAVVAMEVHHTLTLWRHATSRLFTPERTITSSSHSHTRTPLLASSKCSLLLCALGRYILYPLRGGIPLNGYELWEKVPVYGKCTRKQGKVPENGYSNGVHEIR